MSIAQFYKPCTHQGKLLEIKNGFEKTLGLQCLGCMKLLWAIGRCSGCKQPEQKLTIIVGDKYRYCGDECRKLAAKYKREGSLYK